MGTESNLLAYDVERNANVFFQDCADGVNALAIGRLANSPKPLVFAGGNCSIFGFDHEGTESFWTVTCDNVSSLALCDVNNDGYNEMIVGSDDFELRFFKNVDVFHEITETERVTHLCPLQKSKFAYGLLNSTVGVYDNHKKRAWRVKGKGKITALEAYDFDGDGVPEIVSGWSNGSFNVRKDTNGDIIYKGNIGNGSNKIASLLTVDYRLDGKEELIVCGESGEIRGYLPMSHDMPQLSGTNLGDDENTQQNLTNDQRVLAELQIKKQELTNELRILEKGMKSGKDPKNIQLPPGALPPGTSLNYGLDMDIATQSVLIKVSTTAAQVVIVNLIVIDKEGLMLAGKELCMVSPTNQSNSATIPIKPVRNAQYSLRVQVFKYLIQTFSTILLSF